jgi:hypothetical protein
MILGVHLVAARKTINRQDERPVKKKEEDSTMKNLAFLLEVPVKKG